MNDLFIPDLVIHLVYKVFFKQIFLLSLPPLYHTLKAEWRIGRTTKRKFEQMPSAVCDPISRPFASHDYGQTISVSTYIAFIKNKHKLPILKTEGKKEKLFSSNFPNAIIIAT